MKPVRGLSVMWGGVGVGEQQFFVKAPDFSRKGAMDCVPSLWCRKGQVGLM